MTRKRTHGLTLVEMLIVMVLIVTISAAVLTLMVRGRVIWATQVAPARSVEQAGVLLERLVSELEDSTLTSVALLDLPNGGKGLVFATAWKGSQFVVDSSTGQPVWQNYVVFGTDPQKMGTFRWQMQAIDTTRLAEGLNPTDKTFLPTLDKTSPTRISEVRITPMELTSDQGHLCSLKLRIEDEERQWELARWVYLQD